MKVLFWTGDCLPSEKAIRISREADLYNINGGETTIRNNQPFLSRITPVTRPVGPELQLYAPVMNENVYTNLWRGPFYGYRQVIETFKLTDRPRRLKPIDIYYHFYSGEKTASLRALNDVYNWTLEQEILPLFISDYAKRVLAYQQTTVGRGLSGNLYYQGPGELKTLRQIGDRYAPSYSFSQNGAGYRRLHDGTYYALAGGKKTVLAPKPHPQKWVRLVRANGVLNGWQEKEGAVMVSIYSHQPLELVVDGPGKCRLTHRKRVMNGRRTEEGWLFNFSRHNLEGAEVVCR